MLSISSILFILAISDIFNYEVIIMAKKVVKLEIGTVYQKAANSKQHLLL